MLIPLFPLAIVVYPGQKVPLYIFEERYKEMIADCDPEGSGEFSPFGISLFDEGEVADVGCTAVVSEIAKRQADGSMHIVAAGRQRYRTLEVIEDKPYLQARVELVEDTGGSGDPTLAKEAGNAYRELLTMAAPGAAEEVGADAAAFEIAVNCGLDLKQKQRVLEMLSEGERLRYLYDHFEEVLPKLRLRLEQQRRVQSNGYGPRK